MLNTNLKPWICSFTLLAILGLGSISADASQRLFDSDDVINLTLKTDIPKLVRDRSKSYHSATLEGGDLTSPHREIDIEVGTRGMTSLRVCRFPFIRLKLKSDQTRNTVFDGIKKLKIVTHCNRSDIGDSYTNEQQEVILQYLTYKMYSILTDYSFKVRLARMRYEDTSGNKEPFTKYALLLEPIEGIASRHSASPKDADVINDEGYSSSALNADYTGLAAAFEFMIGNGDWHVFKNGGVNFLNMHAIYGNDIKLLPIPYDLDRAGMCNGAFAFHSVNSDGSTFPIVGDSVDTIREIYQQHFAGRKLYRFAFSRILEKKQDIYRLYENFSSLYDSRFRSRTLSHLRRFYAAISDDMREVLPGDETDSMRGPVRESHNSEYLIDHVSGSPVTVP